MTPAQQQPDQKIRELERKVERLRKQRNKFYGALSKIDHWLGHMTPAYYNRTFYDNAKNAIKTALNDN